MNKLEIIRLGHPALRKKSTNVKKTELKSPKFQQFLDDLAGICIENNGVGIAAPQVGVNKRIIVVHVDTNNPRYKGKKPFPLTVVINPVIFDRSKTKKEDWEGDLSASIRGLVPRPVACKVRGMDRKGEPLLFDLKYDFHARVFIHEVDHLNGKFFIDHVNNKDSICEYTEWQKYHKKQ